MEWQPIETAPKDFITEVDLWAGGRRATECLWAKPDGAPKGDYAWCESQYEDGWGWTLVRVENPTHWMPIPAPPEEV